MGRLFGLLLLGEVHRQALYRICRRHIHRTTCVCDLLGSYTINRLMCIRAIYMCPGILLDTCNRDCECPFLLVDHLLGGMALILHVLPDDTPQGARVGTNVVGTRPEMPPHRYFSTCFGCLWRRIRPCSGTTLVYHWAMASPPDDCAMAAFGLPAARSHVGATSFYPLGCEGW